MNDALVPTGLCRCMFKWMGLNLTIEMTGHSFLGSRAGNMNGLWQRGAWWLMPLEEEPTNLWRKTTENHPCHKCERLENPRVVVLFLNLATPYPLYHLIPVWRSLYFSLPNLNGPIYHPLMFLSSAAYNVVGWNIWSKPWRAAGGRCSLLCEATEEKCRMYFKLHFSP